MTLYVYLKKKKNSREETMFSLSSEDFLDCFLQWQPQAIATFAKSDLISQRDKKKKKKGPRRLLIPSTSEGSFLLSISDVSLGCFYCSSKIECAATCNLC